MRRVVLSHSRMATYFRCPSAYKFAHFFPQPDIRDLSEDGFVSFPMDVGSAIHIAMQDYMLHGDYHQAVFRLWQNYPFALYDRGYVDGGRTIFAALSAFDHWISHKPREYYKLITVDGKPSNELVIEIDIGSIGDLQFVYQMHIDFVVERQTDGLIIPVDIKSYRGEDKLARYEFSLQLVPYMLGINAMLLRPETFDFVGEYWFTEIQLSQPVFKTLEVRKTAEHLEYWISSVQQIARGIASNVVSGRWPRNDNACISFNEQCRWAEYCWTKVPDSEHEAWFATVAEGKQLRNDEKPAFKFTMEIL